MCDEDIYFGKVLLKQSETVLTHLTRCHWPLTQKSIGLTWLICYPGCICGISVRKVGQGVLELLIGNEKVTYGPTDMCKAICLLFFEGGIIKEGYMAIHFLSFKISLHLPYYISHKKHNSGARYFEKKYISLKLLLQHVDPPNLANYSLLYITYIQTK